MGLSTVGDISKLQAQFASIKDEIDKRFDKTILTLEETSWVIIRKKRDYLLWTTDWTMTPGCTVDQAAWSAYRQSLRDITKTAKPKLAGASETLDMSSVTFPTKPS